ncbi:MAG: hypothetical protein PHY54_19795 [Methylococcales bacterium]|nr:hypothetical protein [Methylococcales bacterium]
MTKHTATVTSRNSRVRKPKVKDGVAKAALVLECYHPDFELPFLRFFNCTPSKVKGRFGVSKDSAFADLYRISTGEMPPNDRYRSAQQLISHLHQLSFDVEYELKKDHFRIGKIYPTKPMLNDGFIATGKLINKTGKRPKVDRKLTEQNRYKLLKHLVLRLFASA